MLSAEGTIKVERDGIYHATTDGGPHVAADGRAGSDDLTFWPPPVA